MKRFFDWQIVLAICLVILSALVYFLHYLIFRDIHHIFLYLIGDVGFVFIEVLIVTLVLHRLLAFREKRSMLNKLNMVIGAFFSEVGKDLMLLLSNFDSGCSLIKEALLVNSDWTKKDFYQARRNIAKHSCDIELAKGDLGSLKSFLIEKRYFLLNLLENPNLLEHESFTNLLWAIFHLTEELANRKDLSKIPQSDAGHIANDIKRGYKLLLIQWLAYMRHLKQDYPYLFSMAMRTNPIDENASVEVS